MSYHIILRILDIKNGNQEIWFKNNYCIGLFIKYFINLAQLVLLNTETLSPPPQSSPPPTTNQIKFFSVIFKNKDEKSIFLNLLNDIDLSVYSKNRCFRIYKSCKRGKNTFLTYSNISCVPAECENDESQILNISLVTKSMTKKNLKIEFYKLIDVVYASKAENENLVKNFKKQNEILQLNVKNINSEIVSNITLEAALMNENLKKIVCKCCNRFVSKPKILHKCPAIVREFFACYCRDNKFIDVIIPNYKPHNYILRTRSHACYFKKNPCVPHKFNHIYFTLDTKNQLLFFKCHDQECKTIIYKSHNYIKYYNNELNKYLDDIFLKSACNNK